MTPEIELLRANPDLLQPLQDQAFFELVDQDGDGPSERSHLSAAQPEDPAMVAICEAADETNALITWFGEGEDQVSVGLWRGPEQTPLDRAPVVVLDTESEYWLVAATVGDYLLSAAGCAAFDEYQPLLAAAGMAVSATWEEIITQVARFLEAATDPNEFFDSRHEERRAARGLGPR
jgi:hypothetical protein